MTTDTQIGSVHGWEALDSRGNPTVGCEVILRGGGRGRAIVPAGASTGRHEAVERRDGGSRYLGKGVRSALANLVELERSVRGLDAAAQRDLDDVLRMADGSSDLHRLGANSILGISIAAAIAVADQTRRPLYQCARLSDAPPLIPMPMINIVSGGAHAGRMLDIQDVLVIPVGAGSFSEALEYAWRVRHATAETAEARGLSARLVADEGGLGLPFRTNLEALRVVNEGITRAGLEPGNHVSLAVDVAASQFYIDGQYVLRNEGRSLTSRQLVSELTEWCAEFPIVSLEDVLAEDDWEGWRWATSQLPVQLLGDDLFVTTGTRLARGVESGIANAVLVKPNQAGTLTAALDVLAAAKASGYRTVLSARSGDTEDSWLADLAVAWQAGQIKVGSTQRSERTAKWNRLLQIESEQGAAARFAGWPPAS